VNDAMQMIDGKVAGVSVNSAAAADPNSSSSIQVRGASSLKAGNSPLVVIDGMPGGDLRNIAQADIESITVLKDGSAAAIAFQRSLLETTAQAIFLTIRSDIESPFLTIVGRNTEDRALATSG